MTPFAQLEHGAGLSKAASPGTMLRGLHNLVRGGIWKHVADKTAPTGMLGRTARLFHNPVTNRSTKLNYGLMGYGLTGMGTQMFGGPDLPGSNLAFNVSTPILGSLFAASSAVNSLRAGTDANKARMKEDLMTGARGAGSDMMSLGQMDSRFLTQPGLAQQYLKQNDPSTAKLVDQYSTGQYKPMTGLRRMQSLFENPQALINDRVDQQMHGMMPQSTMLGKSGSFGKAIGTGFSHAFPWLFPTLGVGMIGHSLLSDKPYDETAIRSRGYAGGQAKIQQELGQLSGMERFALQLDPSLFASRLEKKLPGTIQQWEQSSGQKHQPGLLSGIANNWNKGGETNYYQYDAKGGRHYL